MATWALDGPPVTATCDGGESMGSSIHKINCNLPGTICLAYIAQYIWEVGKCILSVIAAKLVHHRKDLLHGNGQTM